MDISIFFLLLCLLQTLPQLANTFDSDTLKGTSLSIENRLVSANGEYSAGFFPVGDNAFCFAIWFNKSTNSTVVWMANRDDPVDGTGSKLSVLNEGKLILTNSVGNYKLFFDNDNVLRLLFVGPTMTSLYWPDPWVTDPGKLTHRDPYNTSRHAILYDSGYFRSSDNFTFFATDFGVVTHRRLTLDSDGNLRSYSLKKMNGTWDWAVTWQIFSQPCRIHGICGPNSLCSADHVSGRRCSCLPGFKVKDHTDWSYGCEPEFSISCNQKDPSSFVQLDNVEYYGSDLTVYANITLADCEDKCRNSCICAGFQYKFVVDNGYHFCYPKFLLVSGHHSPNFEGDFYLRVPKAGLSNSKSPDEASRLKCSAKNSTQQRITYENKTVKLLLWFATVVGGVEVISIVLVWLFLLRSSKHPNPAAKGYLFTNRFQRFTFDELRKATRGFKEV
ncbi:putative receptor protein kinase zmpk1 [Quercus suber]|uniref:Receptor protein kinase zmpk1 n=1 Tax=Quercus suber TaxID=58331 RepID=A0AAW0LHU1_QUESU